MINCSVLILTKNEEINLEGCLESVLWSDDIIVFDSFSTDKTESIAKYFGAKFVQRKFDNWSTHQNWALKNIKFKNQWVFYIDADERLSNGASKEILEVIKKNKNNYVAFEINRKDFFRKKQLRYAQPSAFFVRLFKPNFIKYERLVNPVTIVNGPIGKLNSYLNHYPFSKGISHWITKHNSYSSFEAQQFIQNEEIKININTLFLERDRNKRRFFQKLLFYKAPLRPLIRFFYLFIFKKGFLDGFEGFTYSILQSIYEYFISLKIYELKRRDLN